MYEILEKKKIAPDIFRFEVFAPLVADKFQAGQFIVLRPLESSERIPLTIMQSNREKGTITLIVKAIGLSTKQLAGLAEGEAICDLLGPLGQPSEIQKFGKVLVIGGGVGTAVSFAVAKSLREAGNKIVSIIGARNKELMILEDEFRLISDKLFLLTDDGSYGEKGFVTEKLKVLLAEEHKFDRVIAAGPLPMMRAVVEMTREMHLPTIVSLNPIMVDGIGMCGGCRAIIDGEIKFVCVDGPEFDGHLVDFDSLMIRNAAYRDIESRKEHECQIDLKIALNN